MESKSGVVEGGTTAPDGDFPPLRVHELDVDILPLVYEIVRSVERESHECSAKVLELHGKLESARAQIRRLPGIEHNKRDQLKRFRSLHAQLRLKRELLAKYRNMCAFH